MSTATTGWRWRPGGTALYYATAPDDRLVAVFRPLLTSPWWVLGRDHGEPVIRIFATAEEAQAVAEWEGEAYTVRKVSRTRPVIRGRFAEHWVTLETLDEDADSARIAERIAFWSDAEAAGIDAEHVHAATKTITETIAYERIEP